MKQRSFFVALALVPGVKSYEPTRTWLPLAVVTCKLKERIVESKTERNFVLVFYTDLFWPYGESGLFSKSF